MTTSSMMEQQSEEDLQNKESFLPTFIKENDVMLVESTSTTSDLIQNIIEKYNPEGSFYIIDIKRILRRVKLWKELFPLVDPFYAVKCNSNKVICKLLSLTGVGFDVASISEINIVKNLVDLHKIVYANPVKDSTSIRYARTTDVDFLTFDSEHELYKLKLYHPNSKLLIRLKVNDRDSECTFSEKFGVEKEEIEELLRLAHSMKLDIVGTCFHCGSNCKNPKLYYEALELCKYAFDTADKIGFKFSILDIGGGFSGLNDESSLKLLAGTSEEVSKALNDLFRYNQDTHDSIDLKVISEPGRFFVTDSHTLVLSVIGKKIKTDKDSSKKRMIYHLSDGTYGSFSCINYDHQNPVLIPYNNDDVEKYESVIFGNTCDGLDKICNSTILPELTISDLVYCENFGSYSVASASNFNGFSVTDFYYVMT
jgi:ornithine decarboxylase